MISNVCNIIENLQKENPDIQPDDIAIILIDDNKEILACAAGNRQVMFSYK